MQKACRELMKGRISNLGVKLDLMFVRVVEQTALMLMEGTRSSGA